MFDCLMSIAFVSES